MVGYGLDYACAHIIIPASVNLLPIQADFVTERDKLANLPLCSVFRGSKLRYVLNPKDTTFGDE